MMIPALPDPRTLTPRQREILNFIRSWIEQWGYAPTVREIGAHFKIRSPNGVRGHLKALEAKGFISRDPFRSRAMRVVEGPKLPTKSPKGGPRVGLPLVGRIAAGQLHEAIENAEAFDFQSLFNNKNGDLFVLRVHGDSMIEAQIADGDYVIVRRQDTATPGSIVVALTDENEATLKYWFPTKKGARLVPANRNMAPIVVKNARVLGVVVGVVRKLS